MYLSKIVLELRHPSVRQALKDANDMHRNLMAGFKMYDGCLTPRADLNVLYRLMETRDQIYLLVSSTIKPDAEALKLHGYNTDETMIRDLSPLHSVLVDGKYLRFELLASPCKKTGIDGSKRRVFLEKQEERLEWLRRKGKNGGFDVTVADEISGRVDVCGRRSGTEIINSAVLFSGVLRITDSETFWQSYTCGIGPGKAYGLGLLTLARA